MAVCPGCRTEVGSASQCPRCGMVLARDLKLEVERAPSSSARTNAALPQRELVLGDDTPGGGPVMEVAARRMNIPTASAFPPAAAPLPRHVPRPVVSMEEAKAAVDVPDRPQGTFGALGYAQSARKRLQEIQEQLTEARQSEEEATSTLEEALVAIAERARPAASNMPAYRRTLERLVQLEQRMRQLDAQHASQLDGMRAQIVPLDERIASMERDLAALRAEEGKLTDQLAEAEANIFRAKAKLSLRTEAAGGGDPKVKR